MPRRKKENGDEEDYIEEIMEPIDLSDLKPKKSNLVKNGALALGSLGLSAAALAFLRHKGFITNDGIRNFKDHAKFGVFGLANWGYDTFVQPVDDFFQENKQTRDDLNYLHNAADEAIRIRGEQIDMQNKQIALLQEQLNNGIRQTASGEDLQYVVNNLSSLQNEIQNLQEMQQNILNAGAGAFANQQNQQQEINVLNWNIHELQNYINEHLSSANRTDPQIHEEIAPQLPSSRGERIQIEHVKRNIEEQKNRLNQYKNNAKYEKKRPTRKGKNYNRDVDQYMFDEDDNFFENNDNNNNGGYDNYYDDFFEDEL